jgi:hypothetical protein
LAALGDEVGFAVGTPAAADGAAEGFAVGTLAAVEGAAVGFAVGTLTAVEGAAVGFAVGFAVGDGTVLSSSVPVNAPTLSHSILASLGFASDANTVWGEATVTRASR